MFERFEAYLAVLISLLGAITALITAVSRIVRLLRDRYPDEADETISQLERDIVRLDAMVQRQKEELEALKQQRQTI